MTSDAFTPAAFATSALIFSAISMPSALQVLAFPLLHTAACAIPSLTSLSAIAPREAEESAAPSPQEAVRRALHAELPHEREAETVCAQTDANGNVLREESYLRTVYRAFALGDGFA